MPGPYSRKSIRCGRIAIERFAYLYEEIGRLDQAMEFLVSNLKDRRYLYRHHVIEALKRRYPELDL